MVWLDLSPVACRSGCASSRNRNEARGTANENQPHSKAQALAKESLRQPTAHIHPASSQDSLGLGDSMDIRVWGSGLGLGARQKAGL